MDAGPERSMRVKLNLKPNNFMIAFLCTDEEK